MLKTIKNIPTRVVKASLYSLDGILAALKKEEAFKLEAAAWVILALVMLCVPWPFWKKAALMAAFSIIPLCELINSAIEDICDLISTDFHPLIKAAKDKGSAAVLFAIIFNFLVLAALICF